LCNIFDCLTFNFAYINDFILKSSKMETSEINAKLKVEKAKLKQKFAKLTDDDLLFEEGREEEKASKYQAMFFQSEEELDRINPTP